MAPKSRTDIAYAPRRKDTAAHPFDYEYFGASWRDEDKKSRGEKFYPKDVCVERLAAAKKKQKK